MEILVQIINVIIVVKHALEMMSMKAVIVVKLISIIILQELVAFRPACLIFHCFLMKIRRINSAYRSVLRILIN